MVSRKREVPEWKRAIVRELVELFKSYPVVLVSDLTRVPAPIVQHVRKRYRNTATFKVAKKRLILRALEESGRSIEGLEEGLNGTIMLIFSGQNPFRLARDIESEQVPVEAKPGQVAESEIIVPEGPTEISPGPMLSLFGKLRIPYEIRQGKVYIKKATTVAKPGDVISQDLASLLSALGIKPFKLGLKVQMALDGKTLVLREHLLFDLDKLKEDIAGARLEALSLATEALMPDPEAYARALILAALRYRSLAAALSIPFADILPDLLLAASSEASALERALTPKPVEARGEEEEKKEEEKEEEAEVDISEGLGGLFG